MSRGATSEPSAEVTINEIFYRPIAAESEAEPVAEEFLELFNSGRNTIDLEDWALTRGVDFVFPSVELASGEYLAVAADVEAFTSRHPEVSAVVGGWIAQFVPDIIIVEDYRTATRKGRNTKSIIRAIENVAKNTSAGICVVDRKQMFKNNIDEARQFAQQYPELKAWVPDRPKLWESEPRNIIYFEALALAKQALGDGNE